MALACLPRKFLIAFSLPPWADQCSSVALTRSALNNGFSAVASILDELVELQPLLRRLTDRWLGLSVAPFRNFPESKQTIWKTVAEKCGMKQLLKAKNKNEFTDKWNLLVFHFPIPQLRSGIQTLGQELSRLLFPQEDQEKRMTNSVLEKKRTCASL